MNERYNLLEIQIYGSDKVLKNYICRQFMARPYLFGLSCGLAFEVLFFVTFSKYSKQRKQFIIVWLQLQYTVIMYTSLVLVFVIDKMQTLKANIAIKKSKFGSKTKFPLG